jgi:ketosteroid isomerase-like protein
MRVIAKSAALIASSMFTITACGLPEPTAGDTSADQAAIHAGDQAHADAYNAGSVEGAIAGYADDAVLMPPGALVAVGHEAIRKYYTASIAGSKAAGLTTTIGDYASGVSGTLGWSSGTFKDTGPRGVLVDTGHFLSTWRKTNGKWFQVRDIFNMDSQLPETTVHAQQPN